MSDFDVDALLDSTLDDIKDLPEFKPFPPGAHRALASLELKEVNDKPCVEMKLKGKETIQLSNPTEHTVIKEGDEASVLFMLDNEFGRGNMKKTLKPLQEALGAATTRDLIEQCQDVEVLIVTSFAKNKNDPDSPYMNIKELQVV